MVPYDISIGPSQLSQTYQTLFYTCNHFVSREHVERHQLYHYYLAHSSLHSLVSPLSSIPTHEPEKMGVYKARELTFTTWANHFVVVGQCRNTHFLVTGTHSCRV
jgi:hypothetical protein